MYSVPTFLYDIPVLAILSNETILLTLLLIVCAQQRLDLMMGFFVQQEERARFDLQAHLLELLAHFDWRRYAFLPALASASLKYAGDLLQDLSHNANFQQLSDDIHDKKVNTSCQLAA